MRLMQFFRNINVSWYRLLTLLKKQPQENELPEQLKEYQYVWEAIDSIPELRLEDLREFWINFLEEKIPEGGYITSVDYTIVRSDKPWTLISHGIILIEGEFSIIRDTILKDTLQDPLSPEIIIGLWKVYKH